MPFGLNSNKQHLYTIFQVYVLAKKKNVKVFMAGFFPLIRADNASTTAIFLMIQVGLKANVRGYLFQEFDLLLHFSLFLSAPTD